MLVYCIDYIFCGMELFLSFLIIKEVVDILYFVEFLDVNIIKGW